MAVSINWCRLKGVLDFLGVDTRQVGMILWFQRAVSTNWGSSEKHSGLLFRGLGLIQCRFRAAPSLNYTAVCFFSGESCRSGCSYNPSSTIFGSVCAPPDVGKLSIFSAASGVKRLDWGRQIRNPKNIVGIYSEHTYLGPHVPILHIYVYIYICIFVYIYIYMDLYLSIYLVSSWSSPVWRQRVLGWTLKSDPEPFRGIWGEA